MLWLAFIAALGGAGVLVYRLLASDQRGRARPSPRRSESEAAASAHDATNAFLWQQQLQSSSSTSDPTGGAHSPSAVRPETSASHVADSTVGVHDGAWDYSSSDAGSAAASFSDGGGGFDGGGFDGGGSGD